MIIILGESMKFEQFQLERNQSLFENEVDFNLSESGVHPLKLSEIEVNSSDMNSDIHASANYRANLVVTQAKKGYMAFF